MCCSSAARASLDTAIFFRYETLFLLIQTIQALPTHCMHHSCFAAAEPSRIMAWFSHFGRTDVSGFKFGSKALARYALRNRNEVRHPKTTHWRQISLSVPLCEERPMKQPPTVADASFAFRHGSIWCGKTTRPAAPWWLLQSRTNLQSSMSFPLSATCKTPARISGAPLNSSAPWLAATSWQLRPGFSSQ